MTKRPSRTLPLIALLGAILPLVVAVPSSAGVGAKGMSVQAIRVTESDGDTSIVIAASGRPTFTTWKLERPARVVVDISGARLGDIDVPFDANTFAVGAVSATVSEDEGGVRTRVVLTLRQAADYRFEARGNDIVVKVVPQVRPAPVVARAGVDAEQRKLALERSRAEEARQQAEAARKAAELEGQKLAEERLKAADARQQAEAAQKQAEAAHRAASATDVRRQADERSKDRARDEESRKLAEERGKVEEARKQAEAARKAAELEAGKLAVERARAEEARKQAEAAQKVAESASARKQVQVDQQRQDERGRLASERAGVEEARRQAEAARRAAESEAQKLAEERARVEETRRQAEARLAQAGAQQSARTDAEVRRLAEERGKAEEARKQAEAARRRAEGEARMLAEERVRVEEARKQAQADRRAASASAEQAEASTEQARLSTRKLAQARAELESRRAELDSQKASAEAAARAADAAARRLAEQKLEADQARRTAEQAQRAARAERERADGALRDALATQARVEERARKASRADGERVRQQLEAARHETERARLAAASAAAEMDRARREKLALEAARAEVAQQKEALARSEAELRRAQERTDEVRRRAEGAEKQAEAARLGEEERGNAVRVAAAQVEARRRMVESKVVSQEAQQQRLQEAERLLASRDAQVKSAVVELDRRTQAAAAAAARQIALEKANASKDLQAQAAREAARTAALERDAKGAAERSRQEREAALAARKLEEDRRHQIEGERLAEERRLKDAVAARTAEEARRQAAEDARRKEEARLAEVQQGRARAEAERTRLQADRDALVAEVKRLKDRPAPAKVAAAPAQPAQPVLARAQVQPVVAPPAEEAPRPRSVTLRVPSRVQRLDFVDEPTRSSVIIDLDEPSLFSLERSSGRRVTLRLLHADLPRGLERSLDATEYLGPVKVISAYRDPESPRAVRVDVDLAEDVPNKIRQDGSRLYWDFQKATVNLRTDGEHAPHAYAQSLPQLFHLPARRQAMFRAGLPLLVAQAAPDAGGGSFRPGGTTRKRYTGRRVDLDFKSADIHNILRLLSDVGQVNIVTSDDVKGEVTIKMRDVPWDQALDVVLRGKQLGSVREGNLIRVAPLTVLEKELEQEIARQRQLQDVLPTETRLIGVSYADARILQDRAKDLLSPRGKISVDDRTNNLIVSDVSKNLALIEELVRNLDTQTSQVVIEARIVEARSTFVRQIGVQWGGTAFADVDHGNPTGIAFPYNIGIGGGATDGQTPTNGLVPNARSGTAAANPNFAVNLPVATGTGAGGALGLTLGSVAGAFNLNLRLSALENTGQVRILSSPRITTMDNIEASIEQGVAIPISVVSAQGAQTVFVDANLKLTVKPHVTNEGTVMMSIMVTRNEPDFVNTGARGDPTILKKEAKTSMLIRDGDTAVIGGIYTRNSGLSYAKVPFFADIPILGFMFRNRRENDDRTEFLVFITPRISNRGRALGQ